MPCPDGIDEAADFNNVEKYNPFDFSVKGSQILLIIQSPNLHNFAGTIIAFAITWY